MILGGRKRCLFILFIALTAFVLTPHESIEAAGGAFVKKLKKLGPMRPKSYHDRYLGNDIRGQKIRERLMRRGYTVDRYGDLKHPNGRIKIIGIEGPQSGARRLFGFADSSVASELAQFIGGGYKNLDLHPSTLNLLESHLKGGTNVLLDRHYLGGSAAPLAQALGMKLSVLSAGGPVGKFVTVSGDEGFFVAFRHSASDTLLHELGHTLDMIHPALRKGKYGGFLPSELAAQTVASARRGMTMQEASMAAVEGLKTRYPDLVKNIRSFEELSATYKAFNGQEVPNFLDFLDGL